MGTSRVAERARRFKPRSSYDFPSSVHEDPARGELPESSREPQSVLGNVQSASRRFIASAGRVAA